MQHQIQVLFVCLGNICRSPMAEYIFRDKVKKAHLGTLIFCDSAGTSGWHDGENMHAGTIRELTYHGIDCSGFSSRKVQKQDNVRFDYLIAMDNSNLRDLEKLFGKQSEKIFQITELYRDLGCDHIPDPWYTGDFKQTYQLLDKCCEALLATIRKRFDL